MWDEAAMAWDTIDGVARGIAMRLSGPSCLTLLTHIQGIMPVRALESTRHALILTIG